MANLGIHVLEQATPVSIPVVADSWLPYVTGGAFMCWSRPHL